MQKRHWLVGLGLVGLLTLGGCQLFGWAADGLTRNQTLDVKAENHSLDNQSVAVLVNADPSTLWVYKQCQLEVCTYVSRELAAQVPGIKVIDPKQVVDYQLRNVYWTTAKYSDIAAKLGVSRVLMIDLVEFRSHEPGNQYQWQGVITANVGVAEADGPKPDDLSYQSTLSAVYPKTSKPLLDADELTIRKGALDLFASKVAGKFADHNEIQP